MDGTYLPYQLTMWYSHRYIHGRAYHLLVDTANILLPLSPTAYTTLTHTRVMVLLGALLCDYLRQLIDLLNGVVSNSGCSSRCSKSFNKDYFGEDGVCHFQYGFRQTNINGYTSVVMASPHFNNACDVQA